MDGTQTPAQMEPQAETEQLNVAALQNMVDDWFAPFESRLDVFLAKLDTLIISKDGEAA